jgi:hypothetical protein
MRTTSLLLHFLLASFFLLVLGARTGAAQNLRRFPSHVVSSVNTYNESGAIDNDASTKARLAPSVLVGGAALKLSYSSINPVGSKAGLLVESGGLLALGALNGLVINTYLAPSTTPQETMYLSQLLSLQVLNSGPATAEFTVTKPFDQIELATGGVLNAYTLGLSMAYADVPAPLPVELVAFSGKATASGVQLSWQTATELRSDYFAVERATGANAAEFVEIGRLAAAGTSSQARSYQFTDATPSLLGYYRLRQVDADGETHYSPVVVVRATPAAQLAAYPSPVAATLFVVTPGEAALQVLNSQGQVVQRVAVVAGQQQLDVSFLPTGIYYLRDATTGQITRFVKVGSN